MTVRQKNPWNHDSQVSALVALPERDISLFASACGPPRRAGDPVVICFTGAGNPVAVYVKVQQHLGTFMRTLFYDRAGYNRSTIPRHATSLTAHKAAKDLDALLQKIDVQPPYILIAHSYGGIPAREFMSHQHWKHGPERITDVVSGIVLYDTATELALDHFPRIPSPDLVAVAKDVDWEHLTNLKNESGMTDEEWRNAIEAVERAAEAAEKEDKHGSARALAEKRQLENHAYDDGILAVIRCNSTRDYQMMYDEGVRLGAGSEEQRKRARRFIQDWGLFIYQMVKAQLDLVGDHGSTRFTDLRDWGHDSLLRRPQLVGDAVKWILEEWDKRKETGG